ncbi:GNAT family N-acetyltransferase [Cellulomonas sp. JH27-2]|uniref:GNAT family N-acetyltransferase n=1 Tax=Cellulomonas sp. JH27-2 TaxID=2774139 RepID=UPI0017812D5B|nr:GNAT family N-acetyltransferase [Cellulomonas sp. JH27-2]
MPLQVRPAQPDDVPALARLAAATFPLACPPDSTPADQQAFIDAVLSPARFDEYLADPARTVLVADEDGELVGYTMLVAGTPTDADVRATLRLTPTVELSKCYVLAGHHGAGISNALMAASLEAAPADAAGIWLGVNQLNERAQRFYGRHGFRRVGVKHFQVGDRLEDDYVLERALDR